MPNIPETLAAFLATASLGATWSSCSPDFGARSVVDRLAQIEPTVLLAVDGYRYNGRGFDRLEVIAELADEIPGLRRTIVLPRLSAQPDVGRLRNYGRSDATIQRSRPTRLTHSPGPPRHRPPIRKRPRT